MSKTSFPSVNIGQQDHAQLKQIAQTAQREGHPTAGFLLAEIHRARVSEQRSVDGNVAGLDKLVSYRIDFGPTRRRRLVSPEDYATADDEVSVLSPVGAAMLGLCPGDRMPYRDVFGALHFVTIMQVETTSPVFESDTPENDPDDTPDPGPQAA